MQGFRPHTIKGVDWTQLDSFQGFKILKGVNPITGSCVIIVQDAQDLTQEVGYVSFNKEELINY